MVATCEVHGIKWFLSWNDVVNPRYSLIHHTLYGMFTQVAIHHFENLYHMNSCCVSSHHQASICETLMCVECMLFLICRQHSIKRIVTIEHQRVVAEAVRMIVHIIPIKQECTILRCGNETIPFPLLFCCISSYFEHPTYFRNSS